MLTYRATQGVATLGLMSALALGRDAYQQSQEALEMFYDPGLRGTVLPYMESGIAVGMWAEAATSGLPSAAQLGLLRQSGEIRPSF
jgi:hypothetical protein